MYVVTTKIKKTRKISKIVKVEGFVFRAGYHHLKLDAVEKSTSEKKKTVPSDKYSKITRVFCV